MEVLHQRCAGLDVHKATVVGCLRVQERGQVRREVRRWGTTTGELLALGDWLRQAGCTRVAMEATGAYWKPVWHILDGDSGTMGWLEHADAAGRSDQIGAIKYVERSRQGFRV